MNDYGIYNGNLPAISRINAIANKARKSFNPSLNLLAEQMSGWDCDRSAYDYAGTEQEHVRTH